METHRAKRVEIIIEAPMRTRLEKTLTEADVTGYTILPVKGGSGRSGPWTREGQVSSAGGMLAFVCIVGAERIDGLLESVFAVLESHIGVVSVSDCDVIRADRF